MPVPAAVLGFARERHAGQLRRDGRTPYITHPVQVAQRLEDVGVADQDLLSAAVLHDTIEDTPTTWDDLSSNFGPAIADLVEEVTRRPGVSRRDFTERLSSCSERAILIRLADRLDNLRDGQGLGDDFLPIYAQEGLRMVVHALRNRNVRYLSESNGAALLRLLAELVDACASRLPNYKDPSVPDASAPAPARRRR